MRRMGLTGAVRGLCRLDAELASRFTDDRLTVQGSVALFEALV